MSTDPAGVKDLEGGLPKETAHWAASTAATLTGYSKGPIFMSARLLLLEIATDHSAQIEHLKTKLDRAENCVENVQLVLACFQEVNEVRSV